VIPLPEQTAGEKLAQRNTDDTLSIRAGGGHSWGAPCLREAFLDRHVNGDWGEVPDADKQENELSVELGFRILSAYTTSTGDKIWILTEADRSATLILLPEEY
jgi:hypothetical protein